MVPNAAVVTWPRRREVFVIEPGYARATQTVELVAEITPAVPEATWVIDGKPMAKVRWPSRARWPLAVGRHTVELWASTLKSDPVEFEVR